MGILGPQESSSSFQQRKESKKPAAKLKPRALEGWLGPEDSGEVEGTEDKLEIRVGPSAVLGFP